jgi:hypothetical protein
MRVAMAEGSEVDAAVRGAFAALAHARDRNLLRMHHVERVPVDRLGPMFGADGVTVGRWLAALHDELLDDAQGRLIEQLGRTGRVDQIGPAVGTLRADLAAVLARVL